jgi:hypothetical protein
MKTEDQGWRALQHHASAQLHRGFADRVLRATQGPQAEVWRQMHEHAGRQLRAGFAERVLRAVRHIPGVPSLLDQMAFSAVAAAVCVLAVVFLHARKAQQEDRRNIATWQHLVAQVDDSYLTSAR